jgi:transketolase
MGNKIKLIYRICELANLANEGHVPSALSVLDIVWVIYNKIINCNLIKKNSQNRDYFIMSKGHGCLAQYVVMEEKKFFKKNELESFGKFYSRFGGHPDSNKIKSIEASTGSLGHGFPFAAGIAHAIKLKKMKSKVYALVGDGESNEGTIWETCLLANNLKLNNLICIIDNNHSSDRALKMDNIQNKFSSFGWKIIEINGHCEKELIKALKTKSNKPIAIIANTIKGKYIEFMELNQHEWHHKNIDNDTLMKIKIILSK